MAYQWLLQVECGVVTRQFFPRSDVPDGDFKVTPAGSKGFSLAAVVHEPPEIPTQDSISVCIDPTVSRQIAIVLVFKLLRYERGKNLIEWIKGPGDRSQRD